MKNTDRLRQLRHGRQRAVPLLVFGVALAVTASLWTAAKSYVRAREGIRLEAERHRVELAVLARMESQVALLRSTAAMFVTQEEVTPQDFEHYVRTLGVDERYPGLQGLGYAARIPAASRAAVERKIRASGRPNFRIFPEQNREALAILLLEPQDFRNRRAIGYDMGSEAVRRAAMDRARDEAVVALSGRVRLVQELDDRAPQPGFLMFLPIYEGPTPRDVEERRRQLRGFIYSPFRAHDFFRELFAPGREHQMWVEIYDGSAASPDALLFKNVPSDVSGVRGVADRELHVAGRTWTLRHVPRPELLTSTSEPFVRWLPIGGFLVALLLAGLSYSQVRANDALVVQTEELHRREFQQRLLARAGELLSASLDVDENLESLAVLAVPSFADWCAVDIVEQSGELRRVAVVHMNPEKVRWARELQERFPPDPNATRGVPQVVRSGKSELFRVISPEVLRAVSRNEEHWRILQEVGLSSAMIVPIVARGRTLGAITFVWAESGHRYDENDLELAQEIGFRAGIALENARLFADREREIQVRAAAEARVREVNENLERLVEERTRELTAANQELEAFCYSVSHDLRGPLRSVDGFSKALLEDYGERLDEEGIAYLQRVRQAARRMDELITALLALSRLSRAELHVQPVDLSEIAREAADEAQRGGGASGVEVEIEPGLSAEADPRMVRIVLDNLIGNAVKFSAQTPKPRVEVGRSNGAFYVRDNGVGFNPAYAGKLFAPFERLHSVGEFPGTGIGLATVHRIVSRHGGQVWAESEEGKGATFYFTLK